MPEQTSEDFLKRAIAEGHIKLQGESEVSSSKLLTCLEVDNTAHLVPSVGCACNLSNRFQLPCGQSYKLVLCN